MASSRLRALFITDRRDAPYRYRCVQACAQLRAAGALANILRVEDPLLPAAIAAYSVVVLFRLPWTPRLQAIVEAARRCGVPLVFDCDDLVFDPASADLMPFRPQYSAAEWEKSYGVQLRALRRTFEACDCFLGSTPALAEWAANLGKPAYTHPNVVPDEYLTLAPLLRRLGQRLRPAPTIGYFSGSNTHDRDFESIVPALRAVLASSPDTRLVVGGHLDVGRELRAFDRRVIWLPHVSFRALAWAYAACDVTIAPSAMLNAFTDGKSALKFFEPGIFGVPVVASPTREMRSAIDHGVSGWIADSDASWRESLAQALEPKARREVGEAARRAVERAHTSKATSGRLAALLDRIGVQATGKEPRALPFRSEEYEGRLDLISRSAARARRAHEVTKLSAALREAPPAGPCAADAARLMEQILGGELPPPGGTAVPLAGSPSKSGWKVVSQIVEEQSPLGEAKLTGTDPYWVSARFDLDGDQLRYAVIRMRASCESRGARAQLFWQVGSDKRFRERSSASFAVETDGVDATYVVDLWRKRGAGFPRARAGSLRFRFDPLDRPGSARVLAIALVPDDLQLADTPSAVELPPDVRLDERAGSTLERTARELAVGHVRWVTSQRDARWLRDLLVRRLAGTGCEVERLEGSSSASRALIRRSSSPHQRGIDVVVPVFNARKQTLRCLRSVMRHARGDYRLVIIDDASTDPPVWPALQELAKGEERVLLLRNEQNLGFVGTCNRAFAGSQGRDVLLLNSDTRVFRGFLERLRAAAYADERTGIVCPLSNNATILSVPEMGRSNELPDDMSPKQMAALVRKTSRKRRPEIVTPVGFCMYIRAELLEAIGSFDAERFGRGFGEENDFGERAKAAGWKIRAADDAYVWHEGKASFGALGHELESKNAKVLEARHPGYHAAVAQFIRDNPLASIQDEFRWQLERQPHSTVSAVMMLLQASPFAEPCGGTEYVTRDLVEALRQPRVVLAWPGEHAVEVAEVLDGDLGTAAFHRFPLEWAVPRFCQDHAEARGVLVELLELFRVGHVHVQHLLGWPLSLVEDLRRSSTPYSMTVHDFYPICPSPNLLDLSTLRTCCPSECSSPERATRCMQALFKEVSQVPPADAPAFLEQHRGVFAEWLTGAARIFYPSQSTRALVESMHPTASQRGTVLPHAYFPLSTRDNHRAGGDSLRLKVGLIGEVSYPSKGAHGYLDVMRRLRGEPIEWHIFGATDRFDFEQRLASLGPDIHIERHGAYRRDEIGALLGRARIDVGLLLPIWPETFSLTLSELLAAGIPVVASRQGALEDRLEKTAYAALVRTPEEAARELEGLCRDRDRLRSMSTALGGLEPPDPLVWAEAHARIYRDHRATREIRCLRRRELQRLSASKLKITPARPVLSTIQPAARYRTAAWYQKAEQLKPYLPESLRGLARRRLDDQGFQVLQRFRLPSARARPGGDVRLDARYLSTARCTSLGGDPSFILSSSPIASRDVGAIVFNLWCSHHGYTFAQVYWRHEGDTGFSEDKSIIIEVDGALGDWQEYVVRLDPKTHPSWFAGDKLVELRFDPVNYAGLFCVGRLELCAAKG